MKYKHTHTALAEALNKILAERLFKVQDAQELNDPEQVSAAWVKHLYGLVDKLNDMEAEMIGMKPSDAVKLNEVPLVNREAYPPEDTLHEVGLYQYLLQPGEEQDDRWEEKKKRVWPKGTYRLREIIEDTGNRVMYYLRDGVTERPWAHRAHGMESALAPASGRAFVSEELMLIPEDTELPPDYVQEWRYLSQLDRYYRRTLFKAKVIPFVFPEKAW